jgi:hypothetical protein
VNPSGVQISSDELPDAPPIQNVPPVVHQPQLVEPIATAGTELISTQVQSYNQDVTMLQCQSATGNFQPAAPGAELMLAERSDR